MIGALLLTVHTGLVRLSVVRTEGSVAVRAFGAAAHAQVNVALVTLASVCFRTVLTEYRKALGTWLAARKTNGSRAFLAIGRFPASLAIGTFGSVSVTKLTTGSSNLQ